MLISKISIGIEDKVLLDPVEENTLVPDSILLIHPYCLYRTDKQLIPNNTTAMPCYAFTSISFLVPIRYQTFISQPTVPAASIPNSSAAPGQATLQQAIAGPAPS